MPRAKSDRPKRSPLEGYKTYNPEVEGYGNAHQWMQSFTFRLGLDAARFRTNSHCKTPREILEVGLNATWAEIKKGYRILVRKYYPEKRQNSEGVFVDVGDNERFLDVQAAYEILEAEFGQ